MFLQVLWKLLDWLVTFMVERRQQDAKYCLGCAKQTQHEKYEFVPAASKIRAELDHTKRKSMDSDMSDEESQTVRLGVIPRHPVGDARVGEL